MRSIRRDAALARDLGSFDALVVGGGLSGWAAAVSLARGGRGVLLAAEHTSLGHEIWAAMSIWAPPDAALPAPELWGEVARELEGANAARGTMVDPVAAQVAIERLAIGAGVRMLLQVRAHPGEGGTTLLTGKWGLMAARAAVAIDATQGASLAEQAGAGFELRETGEPVVRRALMVKTGLSEARRVEVGDDLPLVDGTVMCWPGVWPGDVILEAEFAVPTDDRDALEIETRMQMAEVAARLRAEHGEFRQGSLVTIAHDPILPRERVLVGSDDPTVAAQVECDAGTFDVTRGAMLPAGTERLVVVSPAIDVGEASMRACQHAPNAVRLGLAGAGPAAEIIDGGI